MTFLIHWGAILLDHTQFWLNKCNLLLKICSEWSESRKFVKSFLLFNEIFLWCQIFFSRGHRTAKSYDLKKQSPKSQHWIERRTANYNSDNNNDNVDLHNKEFCVDVSTYQPVVWQEVDAEQCDTVFVKQCEDKTEEVCADVTETRCQVTQSNCFK